MTVCYTRTLLPFAIVVIAMPHQARAGQNPSTKAPIKPQSAYVAQQLPFPQARNFSVIMLYAPQGAFPRPVGSGVWIGNSGYVATCWHVVKFDPPAFKIGIARDPFVTENIGLSGAVNVIDAELRAHDEDTDVAIYKTKTPPDKIEFQPTVAILGSGPQRSSITPQMPMTPRGANLKTELPKQGDMLLLAGFPLDQNSLVLQTGVATGFHVVPSDPSRPNTPPTKSVRVMLSLVSNPGNSGGPVLDQTGSVVGLLEGNLQSPIRDENGQQVYVPRAKLDAFGRPAPGVDGQPQFELKPLQQNSGISLAVPAKFIQELADANNIDLH